MKKMMVGSAMAAIVAMPATMRAQSEVEVELGFDVVSNYIWRGQDLGGPSVQPSLSLNCGGLSVGAWGSQVLTDARGTKELDLNVTYTAGGFSVGIIDYYCVSGSETTPGKYFEYASHSTSHVFEGMVGYDFDVLSVNWYTNFAGADGCNKSGKRAYTSYVEMNAPFKLGGLDWDATLGLVPYASSFYADASGLAVTNMAVKAKKELTITPTFKLPIFASLAANPSTQKLYFTAGFSINL